MHPNEDHSVEGRFRAGALAAVLALAFLLRVWGIGFGVPDVEARPDEALVVGMAVRFLSGDLNPHYFQYPSFFLYLVGAVMAVWSGIVVLTGGTVEEVLLRYMIPLLPFVCVLSAYAVHAIPVRLFDDRAWVRGLLIVALAVLPAARSVQIDRVLSRTDSRVLATQWLTSEAGAQPATVYQNGIYWAHLDLPPRVAWLDTLVSRVAAEAYTPDGKRVRRYQRFQVGARLEARTRSVAEIGGFRTVPFDSVSGFPEGDLPDWVVLLESPLVIYTNVPTALARVIASEYTEAHRVGGRADRRTRLV